MRREKQAKPVSDELIDQWLKEGRKPEDVNGLLKQITKAVLERAMQAEMTEHLGYDKNDRAGDNSGNSRNRVWSGAEQRLDLPALKVIDPPLSVALAIVAIDNEILSRSRWSEST